MGEETKYQSQFKDKVELHGGMATSLSGGLFMAGMPDLLCVSKSGALLLIENKFWRKPKRPENFHDLQSQLKGPQIAVIKHKLWKRSAPCLLVTQLQANLTLVYVNYKDQWTVIDWEKLAKLVADMSTTHALLHELDLL